MPALRVCVGTHMHEPFRTGTKEPLARGVVPMPSTIRRATGIPCQRTYTMNIKHLITLFAFTAAGALQAQTVDVKDAWARATVQGQKASGAFMKLTAKQATRLVSVSSPVAGIVEVHEMKMEGDVMKMRAITGLDLPPGQTVELKPGGYHVMLLDLKTALRADQTIPVTLLFKNAQGQESRQELLVPVRAMGAAQGGHQGGHQGHGSKH